MWVVPPRLAALLAAERFYVGRTEDGGLSYDPRLLLFEFMQDILLRKAQPVPRFSAGNTFFSPRIGPRWHLHTSYGPGASCPAA